MFVVPQLSIDQLRREGATALLEIIDQAREAGAVVVTGVPKLSELRQACLQAVYKFAVGCLDGLCVTDCSCLLVVAGRGQKEI